MLTKHSIVTPVAAALVLIGLSARSEACEGDYYYLAAGEGAEFEFFPNGQVRKVKGEYTICTRSEANYEALLKTVAALGVPAMTANPRGAPIPTVGSIDPQLRLPAPNYAWMEDTSGKLMSVYGVPCILSRAKGRDAETAAIAGNPGGVKFFAYESPWLGPDQRANPMPLSSTFRMTFEYSANRSFTLSQLSNDPWVVVSDTVGEQGGSTTPAVSRVPLGDSALSHQSVRPGFPENPCILNAGLMGPVIGGAWEPFLSSDLTSGIGALTVTGGRANRFVEGLGTVLTSGDVIFRQFRNRGEAFRMEIPNEPDLVGVVMTAQATATLSDGTVLTNAIDVVIGSLR